MSMNECDGVWMWGLWKVNGFMSKVSKVMMLGPPGWDYSPQKRGRGARALPLSAT